ncbi:hypothetical protein BJ508DRAFT_315501 [Ascobolus immersus RN42]|uniref:Uncharacterized protein n=1 Tax=Ascobolus immersus RN42 TaxID=1160509 RepID=A0A3N4HD28_ASCIM|nr:hypothetical protein BJ508DRAFT_315501 [Ascobolus immersus RN42]
MRPPKHQTILPYLTTTRSARVSREATTPGDSATSKQSGVFGFTPRTIDHAVRRSINGDASMATTNGDDTKVSNMSHNKQRPKKEAGTSKHFEIFGTRYGNIARKLSLKRSDRGATGMIPPNALNMQQFEEIFVFAILLRPAYDKNQKEGTTNKKSHEESHN